MVTPLLPSDFDNINEYNRVVNNINLDIADDLRNIVKTLKNHATIEKSRALGNIELTTKLEQLLQLTTSAQNHLNIT